MNALTPQRSREQWIDPGTAAFVLIVVAYLFATPLRSGGDLLQYAQDDFYYYLVVARNLAAGAGSTFDGTTLTNGYHPLYELVLWGMAKVEQSLRATYRELWLLDVLSAMTIFLTSRILFARKFGDAWLSNGLAMTVLYLCLFKLFHQMEVTLTLPLGLLFLALVDCEPRRLTVGRAAWTGVAAGLLILSRLDAGLLVALCGMGVLVEREYRWALTARKVFAFASGCLPLVGAYLWANQHFFHRWLPISGAAKQLRTGHGFLLSAIYDSTSPESAVMFSLSLLALGCLPWLWRRLTAGERVISAACVLFPFVHWGLNLWVSDWKLWGWYGYSLRFAMAMFLLLAAVVLTTSAGLRSVPRLTRWMPGAIFAAALVLLVSVRYKPDPVMKEIAEAAEQIRTFGTTHPGRYAMGDRAGMVGYVLGQPTIQTEGLMMDDAYLSHIKRQDPLRAVLDAYRVDYYVGFAETAPPAELTRSSAWVRFWEAKKVREGRASANLVKPGCFEAREPAQAGPDSPVMRGEFCGAPVAEFDAASGKTFIFDLRRDRRSRK